MISLRLSSAFRINISNKTLASVWKFFDTRPNCAWYLRIRICLPLWSTWNYRRLFGLVLLSLQFTILYIVVCLFCFCHAIVLTHKFECPLCVFRLSYRTNQLFLNVALLFFSCFKVMISELFWFQTSIALLSAHPVIQIEYRMILILLLVIT